MEQVVTKAKKWGNSIGIVVPAGIVHKEDIKEGTEVIFSIKAKKVSTVKDLIELGKKLKLKKSNKTTQEIMDEIDKELWPENE